MHIVKFRLKFSTQTDIKMKRRALNLVHHGNFKTKDAWPSNTPHSCLKEYNLHQGWFPIWSLASANCLCQTIFPNTCLGLTTHLKSKTKEFFTSNDLIWNNNKRQRSRYLIGGICDYSYHLSTECKYVRCVCFIIP